MNSKMHYQFKENELRFYVRKSPLLVRVILYVLTFISFIMPLFGMIILTVQEGKFDPFYLIILLFFSLIGFYFLRISLWNTFGSEIITFGNETINYVADYKWFKDGNQEIDKSVDLKLIISYLDRDEGEYGHLTFSTSKEEINCVTKLLKSEIDEIREKLVLQKILNG